MSENPGYIKYRLNSGKYTMFKHNTCCQVRILRDSYMYTTNTLFSGSATAKLSIIVFCFVLGCFFFSFLSKFAFACASPRMAPQYFCEINAFKGRGKEELENTQALTTQADHTVTELSRSVPRCLPVSAVDPGPRVCKLTSPPRGFPRFPSVAG